MNIKLAFQIGWMVVAIVLVVVGADPAFIMGAIVCSTIYAAVQL